MKDLSQRLSLVLGSDVNKIHAQRYANPDLISLGDMKSWREYVRINDFTHANAFLLSIDIQKMMEGAKSDGSTCLPLSVIIEYALAYYPDTSTKDVVESLITHCGYVICNNHLFEASLLNYELSIPNEFDRIKNAPHFMEGVSKNKTEAIYEYSAYHGLSKPQQHCIKQILTSKIFLLRGLPGSGKTSLVQTLVMALIEEQVLSKDEIIIIAPTNKAASRASITKDMTIQTKAKTYHKGLGYNPYTDSYIYGQKRKLPYKLIIIEECGLLDAQMLFRILDAAGSFSSLLFCGDENQLLSIAPGDSINDLLSLDTNSMQLTEAFRYESSHINDVARDIINGTQTHNLKGDSVFLIKHDKSNSDKQILNVIWRMSEAAQCDPIQDIQILSAGYKGELGVNHINTLVHSVVSDGANNYVVGERVIFLENIGDVARGDVGTITKISNNGNRVWVEVNNTTQMLVGKNINYIDLAYCLTVHKSQGCEFDHVILLLDQAHERLITKRLLLTAITRAKKSITIIGDNDVLAKGLNRDIPTRLTYIKTMQVN